MWTRHTSSSRCGRPGGVDRPRLFSAARPTRLPARLDCPPCRVPSGRDRWPAQRVAVGGGGESLDHGLTMVFVTPLALLMNRAAHRVPPGELRLGRAAATALDSFVGVLVVLANRPRRER